jgi:hypothetical protein
MNECKWEEKMVQAKSVRALRMLICTQGMHIMLTLEELEELRLNRVRKTFTTIPLTMLKTSRWMLGLNGLISELDTLQDDGIEIFNDTISYNRKPSTLDDGFV